jgi:hypothetical protein
MSFSNQSTFGQNKPVAGTFPWSSMTHSLHFNIASTTIKVYGVVSIGESCTSMAEICLYCATSLTLWQSLMFSTLYFVI